jgi:hypothetical protein
MSFFVAILLDFKYTLYRVTVKGMPHSGKELYRVAVKPIPCGGTELYSLN